MSRTYWKKESEESFLFLGAYADGHAFPKGRAIDKQFQGCGVVDIPGFNINQTLAAMADRVMIVGIPTKYRNRIQSGEPTSIEWATIDTYLK